MPCSSCVDTVSGGSHDWAKDKVNIKYSFAIELRSGSFVKPPTQIVPEAEEVWAGIMFVANKTVTGLY